MDNRNDLFIPLAIGVQALGAYAVRIVTNTGNMKISFKIPFKCKKLIGMKLIGMALTGEATADIDMTSEYCADGEIYNTNSESDTTTTYDTQPSFALKEFDMMKVFTQVKAGYNCGLRIDHNTIANSIDYIGVLITYEGF